MMYELEYRPMPNVMAALPNIGGTLYSTPHSPTTGIMYSNAAKTRTPLKLDGVPQTNETISPATSRPNFTVLWGHVEEILLLNKIFPIVDMCLRCEDVARAAHFRPAF